jgi:proteasome lid subunit RPN8/RPN11
MLVLSQATLDTIREQGRASYPEECCGLLIGRIEVDRRVALEAVPVLNVWTSDVALTEDDTRHSLRDRFYIPPREYLRVQRAAARQDLDVVGCYHTHPDDRAWPSERDRVGAAGVGGSPDFSFVILAVLEGRPADVASALLSADGQQWLPEELVIQEG